MKQDAIRLSVPHLLGNEIEQIKEMFARKWTGEEENNITVFENSLEEYFQGSDKVVGLSSGTAAIHLALILLNVNKEDEVLCQSFTFSATINPIIYQGAKPIFIDSEQETWNMCPVRLEEAIIARIQQGKKPKAILFVHIFGMPAKIDEILEISARYEIPVIEDAAEALGSRYKGKLCGTFGDIGIVSFNLNKIMTTFGGGAIICKSKEVKEKAIFYATQSRDRAPYYQHSQIGYNYRMNPVAASIGISQLGSMETFVEKRRKNNKFYKELFQQEPSIYVFSEPNHQYYTNHWLSCILAVNNLGRGKLKEIKKRFMENNIEYRYLWKPMHLQPIFEEFPSYGGSVCEELFANGLCLPSGSNLSSIEKERIKKIVADVLS